MKTTDVFFKDTNFVGRQIENVQDLVKALAANMDIAKGNTCCGYTTIYDKEVDDEDGNVTYVETEKTEEELFNEMKEDLDNGHTLFAGFFLDCYKFDIVPAKATTLQTDFYVGQEVYLLINNKITKTTIEQIWLEEGKNSLRHSDYIAGDICNEFYARCQTIHHNSPTFSYICDKIDSVRAQDESFVSVAYNGQAKLVKLSEVFATKEELVKHLMKD